MKVKTLATSILAASALMAGVNTAVAHEAGDIIVRVGAVTVDPRDESSNDVAELTALGADSNISVEDNTQVGLNFVYMLSDQWAIEVLGASPFEHDINVDVAGIEALTGIPDGKYEVGSTKHLPPTVSLQYFLFDNESRIQPYVGLGVNYTVFFDQSSTGPFSDLDLDNSLGLTGQVGVDVMLTDKILFNAAAWRMDIDTDAEVDVTTLGGSLGAGETISLSSDDVDIDPMVYMMSIGYKF